MRCPLALSWPSDAHPGLQVKPEMAALNAGSLNYLKAQRSKPKWAWQPMVSNL